MPFPVQSNFFSRLGSCCPFLSLVHAVHLIHTSFLPLFGQMPVTPHIISNNSTPIENIPKDTLPLTPHPGRMSNRVLSMFLQHFVLDPAAQSIASLVSTYLSVALKCGPETSSFGSTWKLIRKSRYWPLSQIYCVRNSF